MGLKDWKEKRRQKKETFKSEHGGKNKLEHFFTDSKFINGVKAVAPDVLNAVGTITGVSAFSKVADVIKTKQDIPADVKEKLLAIHQQELEELKLILDDVKDARDLQKTALAQDDMFAKRFVYYLAILIIISAVLFGVALMFIGEIPEGNRRLVEMFADIFLFAGAITVINFFFGSSKGSRDKDELMGGN